MTDTQTIEYQLAESAYVIFFIAMLKQYQELIELRIAQTPGMPPFAALCSIDYAKATFHDAAYMVAIIEDIVKGRRFE
jgi:hypothetical protein